LVRAQKELFEAIKDSARNPALLRAARYKLKQWKLTDSQIKSLETNKVVQTEIEIYSDYDGFVFERFVSLGDHLTEGMPMFHIINLSKVWVMFEAYETDLPWLKIGDKVQISFQSIAGEKFEGKISYIDPFINPSTRITQVRVELKNNGLKLKPEMFAKGEVEAGLQTDDPVMIVPQSAVLWTGKRAVVYVKVKNTQNPEFKYREITLGERLGDFYIVKEGLEEGEEIATNGVFRIDAASQLAGKPSMMNSKNKVKIEVSSEFQDQLSDVISSYLVLKDALVNDDEVKAKDAAKNMIKVLSITNPKLLKGDVLEDWNNHFKNLNTHLDNLIKGEDIEIIRVSFIDVSNQISEIIENYGIGNPQNLYLQYCPMADAFWISNKTVIRNPYYGNSMLECGEVKKKL